MAPKSLREKELINKARISLDQEHQATDSGKKEATAKDGSS